ncbi:DUF6193 family natural product biosynthesis protein [Kitasatospora viridis]|uniref:DUF6193 family natural product biosynthesis protein n=1 Tax=Kitasatospora viridis TaxID=281105 RepID=UPI0011A7E77C|nr:DUF6193 family natural product biosynthesis protein [Kitasatospora viridis]
MNTQDRTPRHQPPLPARPVLPDLAAARRRGPTHAVDAAWQALHLRWQWHHETHRARPFPALLPLWEAAAAQPRLRRLYPFTSHYTLRFSSTTTFPWTPQAGLIEPLHNGRFTVRSCHPSAVVGEVGNAEDAVALLLDLLPADSDPVVTSGQEDA